MSSGPMMSSSTPHDLNQRYVRLTDRCRSQWTFYQFLQGVFKHLRGETLPLEIDYQDLFGRLRGAAEELGQHDSTGVERTLDSLSTEFEGHGRSLRRIDEEIQPSLLRRFFDRLRTQDEKILLAILKFYLLAPEIQGDVLDKVDVLFTRLAENSIESGGSLPKERHELERILLPLVSLRSPHAIPVHEIEILTHAINDLRAEAMASRTFVELVSGGAMERFRTLKRRLGETYINPTLLPILLEATVMIKNRFRELLADEEVRLLEDTSRVRELQRQAKNHPDLVTPEFRDVLARFEVSNQKVEQGREQDNLRREDILALRVVLNQAIDQFDITQSPIKTGLPGTASRLPPPSASGTPISPDDEEVWVPQGSAAEEAPAVIGLADPLLQECVSKIVFAIELVGRDVSVAELRSAKEFSTLRLETAEIQACLALMNGTATKGTLSGERDTLLVHGAALRLRMDEEAREIERLQRKGSDRLAEILENATGSLERASDFDRRFRWLVEDCLFRGETADLDVLQRSHFRLLRAYSGLWLVHNQRGGIAPF